MTETADDCPDCRHVSAEAAADRTGPLCMRLEPAMPAKFMRRPTGLCGPAAKLWEPHKPNRKPNGRRHHDE